VSAAGIATMIGVASLMEWYGSSRAGIDRRVVERAPTGSES
jgi:hypothetical protein